MPRYLPHLNGSDLEARSQGQEKGLHSTLHVDGGDAIKGNGTETSYKEIGNRCHRGTDVKETGQWNSWSFSVPVLSLYPI
ncbi:hypothetical protein WN943_026952 [Citrus x changshan-huyou]